MTSMSPIVVHHVAEEAVEEIEAAGVRDVGCLEPEVPLADHAGDVAQGLEMIWNSE